VRIEEIECYVVCAACECKTEDRVSIVTIVRRVDIKQWGRRDARTRKAKHFRGIEDKVECHFDNLSQAKTAVHVECCK
jgi:hypothetical protein